MRKYAMIWNKIKKEGNCSIAAKRELHLRIIKAVIQEKYRDLGFKYELSERDKKSRLAYCSDGAKVTFTLHITGIGLGDI